MLLNYKMPVSFYLNHILKPILKYRSNIYSYNPVMYTKYLQDVNNKVIQLIMGMYRITVGSYLELEIEHTSGGVSTNLGNLKLSCQYCDCVGCRELWCF